MAQSNPDLPHVLPTGDGPPTRPCPLAHGTKRLGRAADHWRTQLPLLRGRCPKHRPQRVPGPTLGFHFARCRRSDNRFPRPGQHRTGAPTSPTSGTTSMSCSFHTIWWVRRLRDRGLSAGRIGAELGQEQRMGVPVGDYLSIVKSMPEARFVDAAEVIIKTRMVKSDEGSVIYAGSGPNHCQGSTIACTRTT